MVETVLTSGVFWTGLIGFVGIVATFFAPTWTQRTIERRRERREFRRAMRVVADEMQGAAVALRFSAEKSTPLAEWMESFLVLAAWEAERAVLAASLTDDVWQTVSHTAEGMTKGRLALSVAPSDKPLRPEWLAIMQTQADELDRAAKLLLDARPLTD